MGPDVLRANARQAGTGRRPILDSPADQNAKTKSPDLKPGLFWCWSLLPDQAWLGRSGLADQAAAGLKIFEAPDLIGSALSLATFLLSSASSLVWAVKASNCLRACEVHSSIASEGDLTPTRACAKSRLAEAASFIISMTLAEYSLAPLLNTENTASMVPLWVSAASLNLA